jgi:hypothetical protein
VSTTQLCRVGFLVADIKRCEARFGEVLGLEFRTLDLGDIPLKVMLGESGFEPMQSTGMTFGPIAGPFVELGLAVKDVEACKNKLMESGFEPIVSVPLPIAESFEYLFGPAFHGIPVMVNTIGDLEAEQAPFLSLAEAALPKLGRCSLLVDDLGQAVADFGKFYDMAFVPADPSGLGRRAAVGSHRIRLIERGPGDFEAAFRGPLASIEIAYDNVEAQRDKFASAGIEPLHATKFKSGRNAYYFGAQFEDLPFGIYAAADDAEFLGAA